MIDSCSFAGFRGLEDVYRPSLAASFANSDVRCRNTTFRGGNGLVWQGNTNRGREAIEATLCSLRLQVGTVVDTGALGTAPPLLLNGGVTIIDPGVNATWTANGNAVVTRVALPVVSATGLSAGGVATIDLHSPEGTLGALMFGFPADRQLVAGVAGDAWLDAATLCVPVAGVQNGVLRWTTAVPAIWPWPVEVRWQGLVLDQGLLWLTDPGAAVLR